MFIVLGFVYREVVRVYVYCTRFRLQRSRERILVFRMVYVAVYDGSVLALEILGCV